jgi:hypothetical protein
MKNPRSSWMSILLSRSTILRNVVLSSFASNQSVCGVCRRLPGAITPQGYAVCFNVLLLLLEYTKWRAGVSISIGNLFCPP